MTKLTDKQIRWIFKHAVDLGDYDKFWMSRNYGVSVRKVEKSVKIYMDTTLFANILPKKLSFGLFEEFDNLAWWRKNHKLNPCIFEEVKKFIIRVFPIGHKSFNFSIN